MNTIVLIAVFHRFLEGKCPNPAPNLHTTGGRRGHSSTTAVREELLSHKICNPNHPTWGGGGAAEPGTYMIKGPWPPPVEGWGGRGAGADDPENRHKNALQASIAQASVCEGRNPACE